MKTNPIHKAVINENKSNPIDLNEHPVQLLPNSQNTLSQLSQNTEIKLRSDSTDLKAQKHN